MLDVQRLLAPIPGEDPCGPDLEYDADFQTLEIDARGQPEQEIGRQSDGTPIRTAGVPPKWDAVHDSASKLLLRSKDIRAAVRLTQSLTETEGLSGLAEGLHLVSELAQKYWAGLYPRPDPADADQGVRINVLAELSSQSGLLRNIRGALVVPAVRAGKVSVRAVQLAFGHAVAAKDEIVPPAAQIEALLKESSKENPNALAAAPLALERLETLSKVLGDLLGSQTAVDLKPVRDLIRPSAELCARLSGATPPASEPPSIERPGGPGQRAQTSLTGTIGSREEALLALDKVCEFIEQTEPSHPAPLLIRRARRLLKMNFLEIIQDLAPDSAAAITKLAGKKDG